MPEPIFVKLSSVTLTREKQIPIEEEFSRYVQATNWVIKILLKNRLLTKKAQILATIRDEFSERFDNRETYMNDVVRSACAEIVRHRKLAITIRSMRDKTPFFKKGRVIFSQPIVEMSEKALILTLSDCTRIPIPYDKFSRNQNAEKIAEILKGNSVKVDAQGKIPTNKRYGRIRLTWNNEGFVNIDIRANLPI
ncbi:MAG: hypothetical protein E4H14_11435 [Candidatus Thorarchaeota archaeon]|nr:MAG: hypothetical protein E4H14_11435 [Candidatus Thorarchaeota archaeon]